MQHFKTSSLVLKTIENEPLAMGPVSSCLKPVFFDARSESGLVHILHEEQPVERLCSYKDTEEIVDDIEALGEADEYDVRAAKECLYGNDSTSPFDACQALMAVNDNNIAYIIDHGCSTASRELVDGYSGWVDFTSKIYKHSCDTHEIMEADRAIYNALDVMYTNPEKDYALLTAESIYDLVLKPVINGIDLEPKEIASVVSKLIGVLESIEADYIAKADPDC